MSLKEIKKRFGIVKSKTAELFNRGVAFVEHTFEDLSHSESEKKKWKECAEKREARAAYWDDNYREIIGKPRLKPVYNPETLEKPDEEVLSKCKGIIDKHFSNGKISFSGMSPKERGEKMQEIFEDVAEAMDVDVKRIKWMKPKTQEEFGLLGAYPPGADYIKLNGAYVVLDNPDQHEDIVLTVFHELYHARQWEAVLFREYGYSNDRLSEWYLNYRPGNYIGPNVDDEAYRKQPVERDAYRFERELRQYIHNLKNETRQ